MNLIPPSETERILWDVVNRFLIPKFRELNMNASGEWLNNLEVEVRDNGGAIRGRDYSEYLAKGREPGGRPPISAIEKWVTAKFGISGNEAKSRAFAIANKIAKEGTTWHQKGGSDLIEVLQSREVIDFINSEMARAVTVTISEELIRNAQNALL